MNKELINKKKEEWITNHYDQLTKENYKSWLSEREFSGQGSLCILKSCLFKRNHVVFSKLQEKVLLDLLYQEDVVDIREYYPIFATGDDKVICTTFLVSRRKENEIVDEAISVVREVNKSNGKRISFQNEFYEERGISYKVVTEKDLIGQNNKQYNYKLFYKAKCNAAVFERYRKTLVYQALQKQIKRSGCCCTVNELIREYQGQELLQAIEYLKYMIAHKEVQINWNEKFTLSSVVSLT